ncbi:hypothetical protein ANO11243_096140 [Dothideomycetidae sp. 11243]|nr:hypothetical protein ANO11243_096140 [fungal sp. No.11243]
MTAARLFPFNDLKQSSKKLDYVWFGFKVYQELLFPYYKQLQEAHPGRQVVIIEDNCSIHHKAPISPDLNAIETLHREELKPLSEFIQSITSSSRAVKQEADSKLRAVWQGKSFDEVVVKYCSYEAIEAVRIKCRDAHGHNNYAE